MKNNKPKILLTGASGFVGGVILRELIKQGHRVMLLVRNPQSITIQSSNIQIVVCTLENITPEAISTINSFKPEAIIHSAWAGTENTDRNDTKFVLTNLESSLRLLQIAIDAGCRQWIGFGSQAEYSPHIDGDITENSPTYPNSVYGIAKLATCHMLNALCASHKISFVWLRIFASYGPNYKASYIMPYLQDCFSKQQMPVLKTPHAIWDYIHVDDVAGATLAALQKPEVSGIYNLATGIGHSIAEIALMMADKCGFEDINGLLKYIDSINDTPMRRVADISKIRNELGWEAIIPLDNGLIHYVE